MRILLAALAVAAVSPARPAIVWKPIPFSAERRAETVQYARRHYGLGTWRLVHPRVIVEHYTASTTFSSAWNTFASDVPDAELHELPGTCAHFVIDRDGTIYQLVPLTTMCRHTVGLNWTAIGIEHVGTSDASILSNPAQMRASLRLTLWLMHRFGISLPNVIGHAESLTSPYHRERYAPWRCQTHGDWQHADMTRLPRAAAGPGEERARCGVPRRRPGGLAVLSALKRSAFTADETKQMRTFLAATATLLLVGLAHAAAGSSAPPSAAVKAKDAEAARVLAQVNALDRRFGAVVDAWDGAKVQLAATEKQLAINRAELSSAKVRSRIAQQRAARLAGHDLRG